jgi:hypothetical protein
VPKRRKKAKQWEGRRSDGKKQTGGAHPSARKLRKWERKEGCGRIDSGSADLGERSRKWSGGKVSWAIDAP